MTNGDIHNRKNKINNTIKSLKTDVDASDHNRELVIDFKDYLQAQDLSIDRISRYLYTWKQLLPHINWKLDEPEKDDLITLIGKINQDQVKEGISDHTKMEYKKAVRKFYTDFLESKKSGLDGEELCDFFTLTVNTKDPDPETLPTPRTVEKLIDHAKNIRDKAFLMTLWSSGGRIGEILGLQWRDITFKNQKGEELAKIKFRDTKTGDDRSVPLRAGYLYLKQLQDCDLRGDEPDAFIFRSTTNDTQLSHNAATSIINRARERAEKQGKDIPNRLKTNPHAFRKGRATYLAAQGMNQAQLCRYFGWVQGSKHVAKYVRLSKADVEKGIKKIYGIKNTDQEEEQDLEPVHCHNCQELNRFEADHCKKCGETLESSELFTEVQVEQHAEKFQEELIKSNTEYDPETINEKAKEFVEKELNL